MTIEAVRTLATALAPFSPGPVTGKQILGALKGAGLITDAAVTADVRTLIETALAPPAPEPTPVLPPIPRRPPTPMKRSR